MSDTANTHPPRPRLELVQSAASPEQAAAAIAAVEQFLRETAPSPEPVATLPPWQAAGLLEGVGVAAGRGPWGHDHPAF